MVQTTASVRFPKDSLPPQARADRLAESLFGCWEEALLYRGLAALRLDAPLGEQLSDLEQRGAREELKAVCHRLGDGKLPQRVTRWR
jgi:hypothetical protein